MKMVKGTAEGLEEKELTYATTGIDIEASRSGGTSSPERREAPTGISEVVSLKEKETPGAIGALLRKEGLYSSHLTTWRRQREKGELDGLTPRKRGRKAIPTNPLARKVRKKRRGQASKIEINF